MLAQNASPAVPFWLQITTIALSPLVGFLGVTVGIFLKDRTDRKHFIYQERRRLYSEFLSAINSYGVQIGTGLTTAMRVGNEADIIEKSIAQRASVAELGGLSMQIDLIGIDRTSDVAHRHLQLLHDVSVRMLDTFTGEFDRRSWGRQSRAIAAYAAEFRDAAIVDLGLGKKRRALSVYRDIDLAAEEELMKWIDDREERSLSDRFGRKEREVTEEHTS